MDRRKRKSALENYLDGLMEPPEKLKKVAEFYNGLRQFYRRKWNAPLKLPNVQGVEVNLFRLYDTVMALGGWQKVSHQEKWPDVAEMLGVGEDVMGGDHAIKLIYMRYLSKYEQNETIGDIDDMLDGEMSRSRGRQVSFFATNECPISIGRTHEYMRRDERGNPSTEPDYSRLSKSLLSGLPNEVDFAMNVCTLLSHPGPRLLRLSHAPNIITLLVAQCGVFDDEDEDVSDLAASWQHSCGRDFAAFWSAAGVPIDMLRKFVPQALGKKVDPDGTLLTGLVAEYDVKDPMSWRINQVCTIVRNLSFEPINRVTMAQCWPLLKFLFLCSSSKWAPLYTSALDTLSNLACDINLTWHKIVHCSDHALLRIISDGIFSNDKFKLIRSMEILTGLCNYEGNEETICDFLNHKIFEHIFNVVCVKDIMMCVYTLECLYQISEMGDIACQYLAEFPQAINQLVSMATLEAVSFGPAGLAGMKVVEYQPQMMHPAYASQQSVQHSGFQQNQTHPTQFQQRVPYPGGLQVTGTPQAVRHMGPPSIPSTASQTHSTSNSAGQHSSLTSSRTQGSSTTQSIGTGENKVDQLTEQWIRQNCVADRGAVTPRGELYAAYVDDLRNQYHSLSGSLAMFSNVMKSLYPDVSFKMADNGLMMVAHGIRLVKPHKLAPAASAQVPTPSSISTPVVIATPPSSATIAAHPLMKQILTRNLSPGPGSTNINQQANGVNGTNRSTSNSSSRSSTPSEDQPKSPVSQVNAKDEPQLKSTVAKRLIKEEAEKKANGQNGSTTNGIDTSDDESDTSREKDGRNKSGNESDNTLQKILIEPSTSDCMCEWDGCGELFSSASGVLIHVSKDHVTEETGQVCKWPSCDGTPRSRWSLVTHVQDHHSNESVLKAAAQRRKEGLSPAKPAPYRYDIPRDVPQHPGYSKHAAIDAIRRHAFNFLPRDITDEPEGPVTKSIRLTSCLILRNLARYSAEGRHLLRRHERHLCWLALSRLESSHALAQLLSELHDPSDASQ